MTEHEILDAICKVDGIRGMTVNERLFASGLMDEYDKAKWNDTKKAKRILELICDDQLLIKRNLEENKKQQYSQMELIYTLDESDYLEHQLYVASKSDRVKKQRIKSWLIVTLAFLSLCFLFYTTENNFMMYYFGGFCILTLLFYPIYLRRRYKKHYEKYIEDTYKNRFNKPNKIIFDETSINCFDISGETKINLTIIEEIIETSRYIYLKIKTGGNLIIPKLKVENIAMVQTNLISLANKLKINYNKELEWKWK